MAITETTLAPKPAVVAGSNGQNGHKPTLLIVDDEAGPRESLRLVFKDRFQCTTATCGREGIEYARTHSVDAAILDIKMPDISGVDVLRELKQIDPNTECIMLTGYETLETARAAIRYGASDYLHKPFDVFFIRDLLEKCMTRRRQKRAATDALQSLDTLKKMNEELGRDLSQSNRAVTAGILSAGVVHELNNPLTVIAGYTQLLARDLDALQAGTGNGQTGAHIQTRLAAIQREIERCKDIARRFLNFSRGRQGAPESVGVAFLLEDTAALAKAHSINHGVEITVHAADPDLKLLGYPGELLQVLLNLAVNALQSMNGKGQLQFTAQRAHTVPANPVFRAEQFDPQQSFIHMAVTDTGSGITAANIQKIFQPYFTTKDEGTGLGLAIVCQLVNTYHGAVDVQSTPGKGSTFSVYLPVES